VRTVARSLRHHGLARAGARVLVGCSGGPDSLALLHVLRDLAPRAGLRVRAVYVDHGLRAAAAAEGAFVLDQAARLGVNAEVTRVDLQGRRTMAAARTARYAALERVARARGATHVAVAHTLDDQAETVVMRLLRGAGVRGLAGMPIARPLGAVPLIRPLLECSRAQIERFCGARGLAPVRDPTNQDPHYLRSRVRHQILPLLARENPRIATLLAQLAARLGQIDAHIERAAAEIDATRVTELRAAPAPVRARALEHAHHRALTELIGSVSGVGALTLPGPVLAERRYDEFRFRSASLEVAAPGRYPFAGSIVEIRAAARAGTGTGFWFDTALVPMPWTIRLPRAGDRIRPRGMRGSQKLQDLFVNAKVPREHRGHVPIVLRGSEILCVGNLRASEVGRPQSGQGRFCEVVVLTPREGV
jgi:tRNA(Ile)-lysidine synthase